MKNLQTKFRRWLATKTFKRELALSGFFVWLLLVRRIFWGLDPALLGSYLPFFNTITVWVFLLIAAAFGMHAMLDHSIASRPSVPSPNDDEGE